MAWVWVEIDGKKDWYEADEKDNHYYYKDTDKVIDWSLIHGVNK